MAESLFLSGICKCGKNYTAFVEMPEFIEVSSRSGVFKAKPSEHIVITCPHCNRLVNLGNGSRRKKSREA